MNRPALTWALAAATALLWACAAHQTPDHSRSHAHEDPDAHSGSHAHAAATPAGSEEEHCEECESEAGHHMPELSPREVQRRYDFTLVTDPPRPAAGEETLVTLLLRNRSGRPVSQLQVHHERHIHFLLVSENLEEFHHLHPEDFGLLTPEAAAEGRYSFPVTLGMGGRYLVAVDFVDGGAAVHASFDLAVEGPSQGKTQWRFSRDREAEDMDLTLNTTPTRLEARRRAECNILLKKGGRPVLDLEPYLGVLTHLAIFREGATESAHTHGGGEEFAHTHFHKPVPNYRGPKLYFGYQFARPGRYRIYSQFKREGRVFTVPFDVEVAEPFYGGA